MQIVDHFGRKINYLRLSVTDRCNLRCDYCMPEKGVAKLQHRDVLTYEQLYTLAEQSVALGIEKIRITGGEPLVRKEIVPFLETLAKISGLKQLVLTTNGVLLKHMAGDLKKAGVQRLNISLDSLKPDIFKRITRRGDLSKVLEGISVAEAVGFPIKLNMVVMRGINDDEIFDFAKLTLDKPLAVRFIEYMPVIKSCDWQKLVVPGDEILNQLAQRFPFAPIVKGEACGPAREYKIKGSAGSVGVITPLSGHFCGDCNRIRITCEGMMRTCLFSDQEVDLKPVLTTGRDADVQELMRSVIKSKPACHGMTETTSSHSPFTMAQIGG